MNEITIVELGNAYDHDIDIMTAEEYESMAAFHLETALRGMNEMVYEEEEK